MYVKAWIVICLSDVFLTHFSLCLFPDDVLTKTWTGLLPYRLRAELMAVCSSMTVAMSPWWAVPELKKMTMVTDGRLDKWSLCLWSPILFMTTKKIAYHTLQFFHQLAPLEG